MNSVMPSKSKVEEHIEIRILHDDANPKTIRMLEMVGWYGKGIGSGYWLDMDQHAVRTHQTAESGGIDGR